MPINAYSDYDITKAYVYGDIVIKDGAFAVCILATAGTDPLTDTDYWMKPGDVFIYSLLDNGELPTDAVNGEIATILADTNIRPITDNVVVHTPSAQEYSLIVDIVKTPDTVGSELTANLYTILSDFGTTKNQALGLDIVASYIESLCRIDGVYDVTVTIVPTTGTLTGRNLVVDPWQVAIMETGGITINITGSNNG
jgi:phage-related baseplate assembly protein